MGAAVELLLDALAVTLDEDEDVALDALEATEDALVPSDEEDDEEDDVVAADELALDGAVLLEEAAEEARDEALLPVALAALLVLLGPPPPPPPLPPQALSMANAASSSAVRERLGMTSTSKVFWFEVIVANGDAVVLRQATNRLRLRWPVSAGWNASVPAARQRRRHVRVPGHRPARRRNWSASRQRAS